MTSMLVVEYFLVLVIHMEHSEDLVLWQGLALNDSLLELNDSLNNSLLKLIALMVALKTTHVV